MFVFLEEQWEKRSGVFFNCKKLNSGWNDDIKEQLSKDDHQRRKKQHKSWTDGLSEIIDKIIIKKPVEKSSVSYWTETELKEIDVHMQAYNIYPCEIDTSIWTNFRRHRIGYRCNRRKKIEKKEKKEKKEQKEKETEDVIASDPKINEDNDMHSDDDDIYNTIDITNINNNNNINDDIDVNESNESRNDMFTNNCDTDIDESNTVT